MRQGWKCVPFGLAVWPAVAAAGPLSGDVGVYSRFLDYDLFPLTDEPVVQAALYYGVSKECEALVWGSHGLETAVGGELDLGLYCSLEFGDVTATVGGLRSFLRQTPDATTLSVGLTYAGFDITAEHYPLPTQEDGTRIYGGYAAKPFSTLSLYPMLVWETGLGVPDIFAGGVRAELELAGSSSLFALALVPLARAEDDGRSSELALGLRYRF